MGDVGMDDSPGPFFKSKSQEKGKISSYRTSGNSISVPVKRLSELDDSNFEQNLNESGNESLRRSSIQRYESHLNSELEISPERKFIDPPRDSSSKKSMMSSETDQAVDSHLDTVTERTLEESCTDLDQSVLS
jgi:hypothetical protein